jgi:hypothetical protein
VVPHCDRLIQADRLAGVNGSNEAPRSLSIDLCIAIALRGGRSPGWQATLPCSIASVSAVVNGTVESGQDPACVFDPLVGKLKFFFGILFDA